LKTVVKRLYEAMFLVDSAAPESAAADGSGESSAGQATKALRKGAGDKADGVIKKILKKAGAEIVSMRKWDERRLAYGIRGKNRGTYILCYFHADGQKVRQIERDARLSESIMRVLVLSTEGRDKESIEKDIESQPAERPSAKAEAPESKSSGKKAATSDV
jgi:small subunit ribosomal protein S6